MKKKGYSMLLRNLGLEKSTENIQISNDDNFWFYVTFIFLCF